MTLLLWYIFDKITWHFILLLIYILAFTTCVSLRQIDAPFCGGFIFSARLPKELSWLTSTDSLLLYTGLEGWSTSTTAELSLQMDMGMDTSKPPAAPWARISSIGGCLRARVARLSSTTHGTPWTATTCAIISLASEPQDLDMSENYPSYLV